MRNFWEKHWRAASASSRLYFIGGILYSAVGFLLLLSTRISAAKAAPAVAAVPMEPCSYFQLVEAVPSMSPLDAVAMRDKLLQFGQPDEAEPCPLTWSFDYVCRVVAAECRGESLEGQMAVAQVIRQRADDAGLTPEEVVREKNQFAKPVSMDLVTDSVREACERVLIKGESVLDGEPRFFYSPRSGYVSKFHESRPYIATIGNHRFFA